MKVLCVQIKDRFQNSYFSHFITSFISLILLDSPIFCEVKIFHIVEPDLVHFRLISKQLISYPGYFNAGNHKMRENHNLTL